MEEVLKTRKNLVAFLVLLVISNAIVQQSEAKYSFGCFVGCLVECVAIEENPFSCATTCGLKCFGTDSIDQVSNARAWAENPDQLCQLGCAVSVCSRHITVENPANNKVKKCLHTCDKTCVKKYPSSP